MNIHTCLLTTLLFCVSIGVVYAQSDAKFGLTLGYDYPIVNQEDKLLVARQSGQDFRPISVAISF